MMELILPLVGPLVVFGVIVPLATLVGKAVLAPIGQLSPDSRWRSGSFTYVLIVSPGLAPLIWFASAALHQSEPGSTAVACLVPHGTEPCLDALAFAGVLLVPAAWAAARQRRRRPRPSLPRMSARLDAACARHPVLAPLRPSITIVRGDGPALCAQGVLRRRIEIDEQLLNDLDDVALTAALLHEAEHHRSWDVLRNAVAAVSMSLNPLGRWLASDYTRFRIGREIRCDARAVSAGAQPAALAAAIVAAARPVHSGCAARLDGTALGIIEVRVALLLDIARKRIPAPERRAPTGLLPVLVILWLAVPHAFGAAPLDWLHHGLETASVTLTP